MCANVFVCRVPLGVLFIGLPWVFPYLHPQFMCIIWFPECNVPHVAVHARCKRHKISRFSLLVSNNSDDCRHLKVISNITKQPFEPTKTPALDDSSALVSQRHQPITRLDARYSQCQLHLLSLHQVTLLLLAFLTINYPAPSAFVAKLYQTTDR